jgi:two-component system, OmpR family, phosphate regulon sensor histidine kinase PhoR
MLVDMKRVPVFWRISLAYAVLVVACAGLIGSTAVAWVEQEMLKQVEHELRAIVGSLPDALRGQSPDHLQTILTNRGDELGVRITVLAADGQVLVDTDREAQELENHAYRPEVDAAREIGSGSSIRDSATRGQTILFVARRIGDVSNRSGIVRVARSVTDIHDQAMRLHGLVWTAAAAMGGLQLFLVYLLAGRVAQPLREMAEAAQRIARGDYGHKVYLDRADEVGALARGFNHMSQQLARQFVQLDEDRHQLRAVLSSMVEGVIAIDAGQRILFANDRAGQMLEIPARTAPGRKLWEVVRQRPLHDVVRRVLSESGGENETLECGGPSNKTFAVHVTQLPGEPVRGAVLVFSDTTELRRLERLRQDFVANVSHELKTPLSVIAACVETLVDGGIEDVAARGRFLERIAEQAGRLHVLILDLLSLARIESGAEHLVLEDLPLDEAVRKCLERHHERARGKVQHLEAIAPDADDVTARADEEALREILDNLVDNGLKYTPSGGTIRLRWWSDEAWCYIEVSDTGIGIPASELPRVFERFFRVDKARSRELGGTGLGLSIVKHLAQAMHGNVRVASEINRGTTFTVTLPRSVGARVLSTARKRSG